MDDTLLTSVEPTFWKSGRLKTFTFWPFKKGTNASAEKMAEAGFYAIGGKNEPDLVECFVCGKQLDGWEKDDDPWKEHISHQQNCEFVKLNKLDELTWTLSEYETLLKESKKLVFQKKIEDFKEKAHKAQQTAFEKLESELRKQFAN